ncbi:MAG: glycosyltransferase family 4 protein [Acidimicrobiales bacterium]
MNAAAKQFRVLYVPMLSYAGPPYPRSVASAEIGFGRNSSGALVAALRSRGVTVDVVPRDPTFPAGGAVVANAWRASAYDEIIRTAGEHRPDVILVFHLFSQFASEIRRGLRDTGLDIPTAGFLHGSHWDWTDRFRQDRYPGLDLAELGNMAALDRIYCPSKYVQAQVFGQVSRANGRLGAELLARSRVVGIPYPADEIARVTRPPTLSAGRTRIVYNHALIPSKRPEMLAEFVSQLSARRPGQFELVLTRGPEDAWGDKVIATLDPALMWVAGTLSIADYHAVLRSSDVQVSTAEHEGLGVATLEAMAAGCCAVVPRVGAYPEIVATPETLYDGTVADLTDRVDALIGDPDRQAVLAQRQAAHVARWSPAAIADALAADLSDLATTGHRPLRLDDWLPVRGGRESSEGEP